MDPRRLLTFRAVAHERSFSQAARELALTQPAVSQQVAALEREVGARLFERRPGGLQLTGPGSVLLEHADAIAERLELATTQLGEAVGAERARLRIGAFPSALASLVPAAVARVREQWPGARVSAEEGPSAELAGRVSRGELHIALGFQDAEAERREHAGTERRELMHETFLAALPPDHRLAGRRTVRIADLADDDWSAASTDGMIVRSCRAAGFEPRLVSLTRDQMAIRELIARGLAVTLVPRLAINASQGLALKPLVGEQPSRDVYALLPPGGRHPLADTAFDALAETARALEGAVPAGLR
jgi:DNA-binding transcriptional LysR family regulator